MIISKRDAIEILIAFAIALFMIFPGLMILPLHGREQYPGQYAQADPWWEQQKSPAGHPCCSMADGLYADEDLRKDGIYVQFMADGELTDWIRVPEEVIIKNSKSPSGRAVVWWTRLDGRIVIRCFVEGIRV